MNTLDPAVRDLLAAVVEVLDAADYCPATNGVQSAISVAMRGGALSHRLEVAADYLREHYAEPADAWRVRAADHVDLDRAAKELPA
jgi:hypothetical protein